MDRQELYQQLQETIPELLLQPLMADAEWRAVPGAGSTRSAASMCICCCCTSAVLLSHVWACTAISIKLL